MCQVRQIPTIVQPLGPAISQVGFEFMMAAFGNRSIAFAVNEQNRPFDFTQPHTAVEISHDRCPIGQIGNCDVSRILQEKLPAAVIERRKPEAMVLLLNRLSKGETAKLTDFTVFFLLYNRE